MDSPAQWSERAIVELTIEAELGYMDEPEMVHRDNLVVLA